MSNDAKRVEMQFLSERVGGSISGKNWLGHKVGSGAAKIDALLLVGATRVQLDTCRGAVDNHINHLKDKHGLEVYIESDIYKFRI